MVYRNTGLAAAAILVLAFFQLNSLLLPTVSGPPWQLVVLAGLALGGIITWMGLAYRLPVWLVAGLNLMALTVVSFRIATPDTMTFLIPTGESLDAMSSQLSHAMAIIRNGIEPVIPVSGLVVVITAVLWVVGGCTAYGLVRGRPAVAVVPGLILTLQFATMNRTPTGYLRAIIFVGLLAAAILAVTVDERRSTSGKMAHRSGWNATRNGVAPAAMGAVVVTLVGSMFAVGTFRGAVPVDGVVSWRAGSGLSSSIFGGVSYNPFIGIQTSLVSGSDTPLFLARIDGDVPADRVYFRLLTMEQYSGGQFSAGGRDVDSLDNDQWEDGGHAFLGPTNTVTTDIRIDRLQMEWLPAAYTPVEISGEETFTASVRARGADGALLLEGGMSYQDMVYSVTSQIPDPDVTALTGDDGALSPLFAAAAEANENVPNPVAVPIRELPPDADQYLQLPDDLDPGIAQLARDQSSNLHTPFEVGLALESWFRSSDFRYTTDIEPGHGATSIAQWLLPEYADRPFYRAGYCENFATAMAVLARTLGIPSRVVLGFTPGEPAGSDPNVVVVRDRNAHAWVELWMPTQGWVRFDPTPRGDQINPATTRDIAEELGFDPVAYFDRIPDLPASAGVPRPGFFDPDFVDGAFDVDPSLFDIPASGPSPDPWWPRVAGGALVAVALLMGAVPLLKWWRHRRRMARLRRGDITAAWEEIIARLTDLGERPDETMTPAELAESVDQAMRPLASVYGRAVYGAMDAVEPPHVVAAERSMEETAAQLTRRHSAAQRIAAWYRPGSLLPARWRLRR